MILECRDVWVKFRVYREQQRLLRWTILKALRGELRSDTFYALREVSFGVRPGETLGIIGANGSGKSTLLKVITGILRPDRGCCIRRGRVSALLELGAGFQPDLTGRENVYLNGSILGMTRAQIGRRYREIVEFAELADFMDTPVKHYSSGMYMRLGFAIAVHVDPEMLIVDEVLAVGDESFQAKCTDRILDFKRRGKTILFVSHALDSVRRLCDRALYLHEGKMAAIGTTERVIDFYRQTVEQAAGAKIEIQHAQILEELKNRWGSREVEITEVRFHDSSGRERYQFATGETIVVKMRYRAARRVERPVFGSAIHRSDGVHINGPNTRIDERVIEAVEGEGTVVQTMPAVPLLPGTYYFTAVVYDYECRLPYDHHDQLYTFTILDGGTPEKYGCVSLKHEWSYE